MLLIFGVPLETKADESVTLVSVADTFISSGCGSCNYGSMPAVLVGKGSAAGDTWEARIRFNLNSIPTGSIIQSATLRLYQAIHFGEAFSVQVQMASHAWNESTLTWNTQGSTNRWAEPATMLNISGDGFRNINVAEHVQQWVDETRSNHGFHISAFQSWTVPPGTNVTFSARENSESAWRPTLIVTYVPAHADLSLSQLTVSPMTLTSPQFTSCSYRITNHGPVPLSNTNIFVRYYLSENTSFGDGDDVQIGDTGGHIESLPSGWSVDFQLSSVGLANMVRNWPADLPAGQYYVFAQVSISDSFPSDPNPGNNHGRTTSQITYNPCSPPSITSSPSPQEKCVGESVTFCVSASGSSPLSYQWRRNGSNIPGATASCYTIVSVNTSNAGSYDCVVTNSCGSVTSPSATLTVRTLPSITSSPSPQEKCVGESVTFCVSASGSSPLNYQWRRNGSNIPGATTSCYTIGSVNTSHAGTYDCVVTNSCGSVTSNSASLSIGASSSPPSGVGASKGGYADRVRVSWNSVSDASEYRVYRDGNPIGQWQSGLSYDDFSVTTCVSYSYRVKARNACGESGLSDSDTGYSGTGPATPTGVAATSGVHADRVRVTWNPVSGASEYRVYRNGNAIGQWQTGQSYDDFNVTECINYSYQVKARNSCGESSMSSASTGHATCQDDGTDDGGDDGADDGGDDGGSGDDSGVGGDSTGDTGGDSSGDDSGDSASDSIGTPRLLSPADGRIMPAGGPIQLRWSPVVGATAYIVQITPPIGALNLPLDDLIWLGGTSYTFEPLLDTTYRWKVRAVRDDLWGPFSDEWTFEFRQLSTGIDDPQAGSPDDRPFRDVNERDDLSLDPEVLCGPTGCGGSPLGMFPVLLGSLIGLKLMGRRRRPFHGRWSA